MYRPSHPFGSRGSKCLLSEVATGWKAGSGQLATPEFIYEESLLLSWWDTLYTGSARLQPGQLYCFDSETIWSQRKEMRVVVHPSHVTWCSLQTIQFTFFSPRFAACSSTGKPFSDWDVFRENCFEFYYLIHHFPIIHYSYLPISISVNTSTMTISGKISWSLISGTYCIFGRVAWKMNENST